MAYVSLVFNKRVCYYGNMQRLRYVFISIFVSFFLLTAHSVSAQITPTPALVPDCIESADLGICIPTNLTGFVKQYYQIGLGIIGGLALLFIIFGSYLILTSQGNPKALNNGKSFIGYALVGLLLAIFGYLFVEVIARDILRIPGFK
jgi:hypothetical protein